MQNPLITDSTLKYVARAISIHGNRYSYSQTIYKSAKDKIIITCTIHGNFEQRAYSHLEGYGCKKCALNLTTQKKLNKQISRTCHQCGKTFSITESTLAKKGGKFCSKSCFTFYSKPISKACQTCENLFTPKTQKTKFCSIACSGIAVKIKSRWNTKTFIDESFQIHGNRYDYSKAIYEGMNHLVEIWCPVHGIFKQRAADHLLGRGCSKCGTKSSAEARIKKESVACKNCGRLFELPPNEARRRTFCSPTCAAEGTATLSVKIFIEQANLVHNGYYSYDKVVIPNFGSRSETNVIITCPVHGDFTQMAKVHLGGAGCNYCKGIRIDRIAFVLKANKIHQGKFDYSEVNDFNSGDARVKVLCPIHGAFEVSVTRHIAGDGCRACEIDLRSRKNQEAAKARWLPKALHVHNARYDYSKAQYVSASDPIEIICSEHGSFWQNANNHLNGSGCPRCANRGFDKDKPAILYYLRVNDGRRLLWKIGITNFTVQERFPSDFKKITILESWFYQKGVDAYNREQEILRSFSHLRYFGEPVLTNAGNTELFVEDVLGLDAH